MRSFWSGRRCLPALLAAAAVVSCASRPDEEPAFEEEPGTVTGELVVRIADFVDGQSERRYYLRKGSGKIQRIFFQEHPDLEPGTKLKVWGAMGAQGLVVDKFLSAPSSPGLLGSISSPLIHPTPQAPRVFCAAVVAINGGAVPTNLNVAATETQFHTGPKSVNAYLVENSYGRNSFSGKTYGPFNFSLSGCDENSIADAIKPQIPDHCDHYGFLLVPNQSACDWGGLGDEGTAAKPASDTWYNAWLALGVTAQEPGHNFGLNHASTITCPGGALTDDLSSCTHNEYGDRFDTMGDGNGHMAVWPKAYSGWLSGCNVLKVSSSGTFNLLPLESACDGVQSIQIPFPGGKTRVFRAGMNTTLTSYYLEYRTPLGFDQGMSPQVQIRVDPNPLTANTRSNPHSWILNASGTANNPGLTAGKSFSDPAGGLTITVTSIDPQKAVVQVDYPGGTGGPTCMDGTALTPPGPLDCAGAVTTDGGVVTPPDGGFAGSTVGGRDAGRGGGGTGGRGGAAGGGPAGSGGVGGTGGAAGAAGSTPGATGGNPTTGGAGSPGVGGLGTGTGPATGGSGIGGSVHPRAGSDNLEGGCSCRVGADENPRGTALATLATGLLLSFARRRRANSRRRGTN